jgi:hypothetical protein
VVIYQQVQFIQNTETGYDKNNILRFSAEGNIQGKKEAFIAALKDIPGVANASSTYHKLVGRGYSHAGMEWEGQGPNNGIFFEAFEVDYDFQQKLF